MAKDNTQHDKDFELQVPQASINRILKSRLPENVNVSKEAKQAFAKAAGIFVLYATAAANDFCRESKRQTISAQDVLDSMRELDFETFIAPLEKCLEAQRGEADAKKKANKQAKLEKAERQLVAEASEASSAGPVAVAEAENATGDGVGTDSMEVEKPEAPAAAAPPAEATAAQQVDPAAVTAAPAADGGT